MHTSLKRYNFLYDYIISEDRVRRTVFCFLLFLVIFNLSACDTLEKSTEKYINEQFSNLNLNGQEVVQNTPNNDPNISLIDNEVSNFVSDVGSVLKSHTKNLITSSETQNLADALTNTTLRAGIDTALSIVESSDIERLKRLEIEYGLNNKGLNRLSLLTVQPLYEAENLSHNLFAQGSFMFSDEMGRTANAGIAYRYATSDQKHIYGINMFFDHQWPYAHNRMSIGFDYKTSLYGVGFNKYWGLSDWRTRGDGYDEKPMSGEDIEFSGRLAEMPQLEFFIKGYRWQQEKTAILNPDGDDIWGYGFTSEYTPFRAVTFSGSATKDNAMDNFQGELTLRFNYNFGSNYNDLWLKEDINLETVTDRRFDKVRRENIIKVQKRVSESNAAAATPAAQIMGLAACPTGDLSAAANAGCARLFGANPNDINDIAVYAGDVPGTGTDFFVRRCDIGQDYDPVDDRCENGGGDPNTRTALRWKNVTTDSATPFVAAGALWTTPGAVDGVSNTADLVTDGSGTHAAAETCNALPGGGWYLPAVSELDVAYANLAGTDDPDHPLPTVSNAADDINSGTVGPLRDSFDTFQYYWSSTERIAGQAWMVRMLDGRQLNGNKATVRNVRCARR